MCRSVDVDVDTQNRRLSISGTLPTLNFLDPRKLHRPLRLRIRHEPPPYAAVTKILDAQKSHSYVQPERIARHPSRAGVERIGQPILAPDLGAVLILHGMHCGDAYIRSEHQRSSRGARHYTPIHRRVHRRTTPRLISLRTRRASNSPDRLAVSGKIFRQIFVAPLAMRSGGNRAVFEPVDFTAATLAPPAKIKPRKWILICPKQCIANVVVTRKRIRSSLPAIPRVRRQRMRWRANPQQIHRRQLAVPVVSKLYKSLRPPAMRQDFAVSIRHPRKVIAAVKQRSQVGDLVIFVKILPAGKRGGKKPYGITRRHLDVLPSLARMNIEKMVEPSILRQHRSEEHTSD